MLDVQSLSRPAQPALRHLVPLGIAGPTRLLFVAVGKIGGLEALWQKLDAIDPALIDWRPQDLKFGFALYLIGWMAAGLGVLGQPHITIRERLGKQTFRYWQEGPGYDRNFDNEKSVRAVIDYIHLNPVHRGLCSDALDWKWSSARHFAEPERLPDNPRLAAGILHECRSGLKV